MGVCVSVHACIDSQIAHGDIGGRLVGHLLLILRIWATMQTMRRNAIWCLNFNLEIECNTVNLVHFARIEHPIQIYGIILKWIDFLANYLYMGIPNWFFKLSQQSGILRIDNWNFPPFFRPDFFEAFQFWFLLKHCNPDFFRKEFKSDW